MFNSTKLENVYEFHLLPCLSVSNLHKYSPIAMKFIKIVAQVHHYNMLDIECIVCSICGSFTGTLKKCRYTRVYREKSFAVF